MQKENGDFLDDVISDVKEKSKELLGTSWEKASELGDKTVNEIAGDIKTYVRKNPLKSIGIAAAVGLVIGSIFKSNKD